MTILTENKQSYHNKVTITYKNRIYSFVCIQMSLTNFHLELKKSKEYFTLNEASEANLNADKTENIKMSAIFT